MTEPDLTEFPQPTDSEQPLDTGEFFEQVYDELRKLAVVRLSSESPGMTLQPTALVHEVYLRLLGDPQKDRDPETPRWKGPPHFFAAAAEAMRRILIESARRKSREKHGGGHSRVLFDPDQISDPEVEEQLLELDEALTKLANLQPRIADLVKMRYFGGLTLKEIAPLLEISPRTADSYWAYARAWLIAEMGQSDQRIK